MSERKRQVIIQYADEVGPVDDVIILGLSNDEETTQQYIALLEEAIDSKNRLNVDFILQKLQITLPEDAVI